MKKINKNIFVYLSIIPIALFAVFFAVESADNNSGLSLSKDSASGLFVLRMSDPQGIKYFSLVYPSDKFPYSGGLGGCPRDHTIDKISIEDPKDFEPLMNAVILDCQGNETEFEITAPTAGGGGSAQVKKVGILAPPPPPPVPPSANQDTAPSSPKAEQEKVESAADPLASVQYPVSELGNCQDKESCKAYCDEAGNLEQCLAFAEKHGLLKHSELERGKKFAESLKAARTPGGCSSERECFSYCSDVDRLDICLQFAEEHGFMDDDELVDAKKIQSIVKSGKSLPGNCKNRTACEAYCKNPEHFEECIAFAKEAGFMSAEEIAEAEKFLPLIKSGQTPGGCKSKEECEAFCNNENNFDECFNFADKAGLLTDREREFMKKTGGVGPGGCRGRACETYCQNPANMEACFKFAQEHGILSEGDLKRMEEGKRMIKAQLENGPPEVQECLKSVVDVNVLEKEGFVGGEALGEQMRECIEKMIPAGMEEKFEFGPGGEFSGPGGCKSHEECEAYCRSNPEACGIKIPEFGGHEGFEAPPGGTFPQNIPPADSSEQYQQQYQEQYQKQYEEQYRQQYEEQYKQQHEQQYEQQHEQQFQGPGGCSSVEECTSYCTKNYQDPACSKFMPSGFNTPGYAPSFEESAALVLAPFLWWIGY